MKSYYLVLVLATLAYSLPAENQGKVKNRARRNAVVDKNLLWPKNTVHYHITDDQDGDREVVHKAIADITSQTCLKFIEITEFPPKNWNFPVLTLSFYKTNGCYGDMVGCNRASGVQTVRLGCELGRTKGGAIHEILHALGFDHQINTKQRDDYIEILSRNIKPGLENNFEKYTDMEDFGVPFDFSSIMNYPIDSMSKNYLPTIKIKDLKGKLYYGDVKEYGQFEKLSEMDVYKINMLYKCTEYLPKK